MDFSSKLVCEKTGLKPAVLKNWCVRFPHLIKWSEGVGSGNHRRFPIETVAQLSVANMVRSAHWPVERGLKIGLDLVAYDRPVYLSDTLLVLINPDSHVIAINGHESLGTEGTCINLTYPHSLLHIHTDPPTMTANEQRRRFGFTDDDSPYLHETDHSMAWLKTKEIE